MDKTILLAALCVLNGVNRMSAGDWPRFLGPDADGKSPESGINTDWNAKPPAVLWRVSMADGGFSGPAVADGVVYLIDRDGDNEVIRAISLADGAERWRFAYAEPGRENMGRTRATPTVADGMVYTVSRYGTVLALDAAKGTEKWRVNVVKDHKGELPQWEMAHSAVIDGEALVAVAGGPDAHVVTLDKLTGKLRWAGGGTYKPGYATPVVTTLNGRKQYVVFAGTAVVGITAEDGTVVWSLPWKTSFDVNAPGPITVGGDRLLVASGYRHGMALLQIKGDAVTELWANPNVSPHWSTPIVHDGHIYGTTTPGHLVCLVLDTGAEVWRSKGEGKGFEHGGLCALAGKLVVIEGNTGAIVLVDMSPEAYVERGRINPLNTSKCWVAPIIADRKLLVRSPAELVCLDLTP